MHETRQANFLAHKNKYEQLRVQAREDAMQSLPTVLMNQHGQSVNIKGDVQLTGIDFRARAKATEWNNSPVRRPEIKLSWVDTARKYERTVPKRFELAIWHRNLFLCGLALGKPTWSGNKLRLDLIEGSPEKNSLSGLITQITLVALETYADSIGATQIRIMNPINEKVRSHYLNNEFGFAYNQRGDYCYRDL